MPAAHVQAKDTFNDGGSACSLTFPTNPTTGNLICGMVQFAKTVTLNSVSDGTNTYTLLNNPTDGDAGQSYRSGMFYAKNITGGALTITATCSGTTDVLRMMAHEASGLDLTAPLEGHALNPQDNTVGPGTDAITSTAVPVTTGDYVAGFTFNITGSSQSPGTNFTQGINTISYESEYLIASSGGTIAATFTSLANDHWLTGVMTFKAPAVGGLLLPNPMTGLGAGGHFFANPLG